MWRVRPCVCSSWEDCIGERRGGRKEGGGGGGGGGEGGGEGEGRLKCMGTEGNRKAWSERRRKGKEGKEKERHINITVRHLTISGQIQCMCRSIIISE